MWIDSTSNNGKSRCTERQRVPLADFRTFETCKYPLAVSSSLFKRASFFSALAVNKLWYNLPAHGSILEQLLDESCPWIHPWATVGWELRHCHWIFQATNTHKSSFVWDLFEHQNSVTCNSTWVPWQKKAIMSAQVLTSERTKKIQREKTGINWKQLH